MGEWPTQAVMDFRGEPLPAAGTPAGYAALIARYDLQVPPPPRLAAVAERFHAPSSDTWLMLTPRHAPVATLGDQLTFAFRYEGVNLQILVHLFQAVDGEDIAALVKSAPTGAFSRRLWFLYEWLTNEQLDLPDPGKVKAVTVLDPDEQYALAEGDPSPRHKVINNLPGTSAFCPLVRRTPAMVTRPAMRASGDAGLRSTS